MSESRLILLFALFLCNLCNGQVGIGTTTPMARLDIVASNRIAPLETDGLLIPKIDEFALTNPGVAQDGMLVYLTGSGTIEKGFYYWDNDATAWVPLYANGNTDFYKQATTVAAGNITDTIYRMGSVALGKTAAGAMLDIEQTSNSGEGVRITTSGLGSGIKYNLYNEVPIGSSGSQYAVYNNFSATSSTYKSIYGVHNNFSNISSTTGNIYGNYTRFNNNTGNATKHGSSVSMNSFIGSGYGFNTTISPASTNTSAIYGVYSTVASSGTGVHYGVYASAYGDGNRAVYGNNNHTNGYAGYFSGRGYFSNDLGVGVANPVYRLDVYDIVYDDYVTQIYNRNTSTLAKGVKIKLGNSAPTSTNYYVGFFDGTDGVNGRIQGTGVGVSYQTLSDKRLKTNFQKVNGALEILSKIEPTLYEFKELKGKTEMGFLAQDLQLVFPQAVSGNPTSDVTKDPMMVDYSRLTPLLTAGIKELNEKIEVISKENKKLKEKLTNYELLEKRIQVLENSN